MTETLTVGGPATVPATAALDAEVARLVGRGYAVESRTATQAVLAKKKRIGWFWNVALTIATGGIWLLYVVYKLVNRRSARVVFTLLPDGRVNTTRG